MNELHVSYVVTDSLHLDPSNARTHSDKQVGQIARSIDKFGFNNPILVDDANKVLAGHGRLRAAQILGLNKVPTIRLEHLSPAERRAYAIADNRLAELSGWDREILAIEMQELLEIDLDFEITDIGFELHEIDVLLDEQSQQTPDAERDVIPDRSETPSIARPGDLWQLGEHLLFCGDALDQASYDILMGSDRASMIFSDPPYNVPISGHVSGLGKVQHREFLQASGEMSSGQFSSFLSQACQRMRDFSTDGSIHFICMDWRHIHDLISAGSSAYSELKNICVWVKPNGGMGSLYRSRHELVAVFKAGTAPHCNNVQLGSNGRYRSNIWEYQGMNSFQTDRDEMLKMHPTVKPVAMIADAILDCSTRGDIVLDPFAGSGSTLIAAEQTGRRCRAIELDPRYVDTILARYVQRTGKPALNLWSGASFPPADALPNSHEEQTHGI